MESFIIGIAGGTGSGKTTLTKRLKERFGDDVSVISHDNYYKRHDELPYEERCRLNYDHPDAFDTDLMVEQVQALRRGETIAGVVYAPYLNELFWASKGGGAYMKSRSGEVKRLQVSAKQTLATSVLATGFPYDKDVDPDNNSDNVARIVPYVRDIRRLGSAAYDLSCIAAGLLDGYWELDLHEWDVCAANLIVREAGGVVCDFRRNRGVSQAAGNEVLVGEMLKYIR